jgi:hypothetical protein
MPCHATLCNAVPTAPDRWEYVYDARKRMHLTVNVDTLQVRVFLVC